MENLGYRGLDPYAYLKDVLTHLPTLTNHQVGQITPAVWGKNGPPLQRLAA